MRITLILLKILILGICLTSLMFAQQKRTEFDTWADLATIYSFSKDFRYDGDYGIRHLISSRDFKQIYLRPSVRYRFESWFMLHGGIAWFYSRFTNYPNVNELRPWVGLRLLWPRFDGWVVSNYLRFEYRISKLNGESQWNRQLRGRFQVQITTPNFNIGEIENFYSLFFVEPFLDIDTFGEQIIADRLRLNLGFGNRITKSFRMELNTMFQKGRIAGNGGFQIEDFILRLRMFLIFN